MARNLQEISVFGNPYKNLEDQVTTGLLQIIQLIGNPLVVHLFDDCDLPDYRPTVSTQVSAENSRPDGVITCSCTYRIIIETKIVKGALSTPHGKQQLANHIASTGSQDIMIYITPDDTMPIELQNEYRVQWYSWEYLFNRLFDYQGDAVYTFMVEQFEKLLKQALSKQRQGNTHRMQIKAIGKDNCEAPVTADIIAADERVIIVGGRWGEDVALNYGFYSCQPNRFFLPAKYMAFYFNNRISHLFEIIGDPKESVDLKTVLGPNHKYFIQKEPNYNGVSKYFELKLLKTFNPEITNNLSNNGRRYAYVQRQRYTSYDSIINARTTSDLV